MKKLWIVLVFLATVLVAGAAGAQPVSNCAADFGRCNTEYSGEFRNVRKPGAPTNACPLGATYSRDLCAQNFEVACVCGPPVVTPGPGPNQITVGCGTTPANNRPRRIHDQLVIVCREDLGLVDTDHGCELQQNLPTGYNYAIVLLSTERADGRLTQRLRIAPHAIQETYAGVAWPNGLDRPQDAQFRQSINGLLAGQSAMQGRINQNTAEVARAHQRLDNLPVPTAPAPTASTSTRSFHLDFALGGLFHWNAATPIGGVGGGGLVRISGVARLDPTLALTVYGGYGLGEQSNTPYHVIENGRSVDAANPLHMGNFGISALVGESTAFVVGLDGFIAGGSAPALVPGDISGLMAWRASVQLGVHIPFSTSHQTWQGYLELLGNVGVSNVGISSGGNISSPIHLGLGGTVLFGVTTPGL